MISCIDCGKKITRHSKSNKCRSCVQKGKKHAPRGKPILQKIFCRMKYSNNRKKKLNFDLTYDEFLFLTQISCCSYCGRTINWEECGQSADKYNLDRKDNKKGYSLDNLAICCTDCNIMKRNHYSFDEFQLIRRLLFIARNSTKDLKELKYLLFSWDDIFNKHVRSAP